MAPMDCVGSGQPRAPTELAALFVSGHVVDDGYGCLAS